MRNLLRQYLAHSGYWMKNKSLLSVPATVNHHVHCCLHLALRVAARCHGAQRTGTQTDVTCETWISNSGAPGHYCPSLYLSSNFFICIRGSL